MNEERKTVYIPTWMDTSIPGLRNPYAGREIVWGDAEKKKAAKTLHEWLKDGCVAPGRRLGSGMPWV